MEQLRLRSNQRIENTSLEFQRDELKNIDWGQRLMGIKGARGIGKTTILLQHLKQKHSFNEKAIYISLDDIYFTENKLITFVENFQRDGGQYLYLDEVHKYPNWSIEIKNIYDTYPNLRIAFTGSSMLNIHKGNADLSRRAIIFHMQGLSFRQYLNLKHGLEIPIYELEYILKNSNDIITEINKNIKIYQAFNEYLERGYYPFFSEDEKWYFERLEATRKAVIESDFLIHYKIDIKNIRSIYKLLWAIATSAPFKPNIQKLSKRTEISRNTLLQYIYHLEEADIITLLQSPRKGISFLQKPEKLFLENTNMLYSIAPTKINKGMLRETFAINQLKSKHKVHYPEKGGDLLVNEKYVFEIGGKSKKSKQIIDIPNSYILADELDYKIGNKIPIWMVGLLY